MNQSPKQSFPQPHRQNFELNFRDMSPDEIRHGMATLNQLIREIKRLRNNECGPFTVTKGTTPLSKALIKMSFTPIGHIMATSDHPLYNLDGAIREKLTRPALENAEDLRRRFKAVWRARPGRAARDFEARAKREQERKKARGFRFPGFGK